MDQTVTARSTHPAPAGTSRARRVPEPLARWWRGDPADHPAARPALVALLVATALLYLVGLGASGWGNSFYAAAAPAGSESWKAMFFGASDAAGSITVDKTPMSVWVMALSVRLFGLSSWSVLVPQALMGVGAVALLHTTVKRVTGSPWAGLVAGLVLATTPVAVLMFRFDNPDALLVLLLVAAVHSTVCALDTPGRAVRWLALGGALVGLGFMTKMMQAFLVLPALAGVYLLAGAVPLGRRVVHLLVAFASMVVAGGWWVLVVELWPASSRPYIGGSQGNSVLELTLGYNGLGRLNGEETGSVGGGNGWGETGLGRLLSSDVGGQVAWLLPAALVALVVGLWLTRRAPRTDLVRAGLVVWGLWLLVTAAVFSLMAGIFHAYYTVALAPAIGALVGIGGWVAWRHRGAPVAVLGTAFALATTATLAAALLGRTEGFVPWLAPLVVVLGVGSAVVLVALRLVPARLRRHVAVAVAAAGLVSALGGPTAYAVATASRPHTGSIPSAGPAGGLTLGGMLRMAGGPGGATGSPPGGTGARTPGGGASTGGLLSGSQSSAAVDALLLEDADSYTWVAATVGSNSAAGFQLSTGEPVMALGGFNGSDPSPTLAEFQQHVADGEVHWFIANGGGIGGMAGGTERPSSEIAQWVESTFTAQTVDGTTLYDLSGGVR